MSPLLRHVLNNSGVFVLIVAFRCGAIHETDENAGISHFLEHLLFKKQSQAKSIALMQTLDSIGATWNAQTSADYTLYHVQCTIKDAVVAIKAIASVIVGTLDVTKAIFEKEKKTILEEMALHDDESQTIYDLIHEGTIYEKSVIGTEKSIKAMSIRDVVEYHERMYKEPIVVYSCGLEDMKRLERALVKNIPGCDVASVSASAPAFASSYPGCAIMDVNQGRILNSKQYRVFKRISGRDANQTCKLAWLAFPAGDSRSKSVTLLAFILRHRLFLEAREKHNMIYSVSVRNNTSAHTGCIVISFATRGGSVLSVLSILKREISKIGSMTTGEIKEYHDQLIKKRDVQVSCAFDACMRQTKYALFGVDSTLSLPMKPFDTLLTSIFQPDRCAFIIAVPARDRAAIRELIDGPRPFAK